MIHYNEIEMLKSFIVHQAKAKQDTHTNARLLRTNRYFVFYSSIRLFLFSIYLSDSIRLFHFIGDKLVNRSVNDSEIAEGGAIQSK